jgi:hypothetical protein
VLLPLQLLNILVAEPFPLIAPIPTAVDETDLVPQKLLF